VIGSGTPSVDAEPESLVVGVRTAQLAFVRLANGGNSILFTCPIEHTTIVKSAIVSNWSGTSQVLYVDVHTVAGPSAHYMSPTVESGQSEGRELWIVLEAGDYLVAASVGGPCDFFVSGSILPNAL
jgi:hypothetical protein